MEFPLELQVIVVEYVYNSIPPSDFSRKEIVPFRLVCKRWRSILTRLFVEDSRIRSAVRHLLRPTFPSGKPHRYSCYLPLVGLFIKYDNYSGRQHLLSCREIRVTPFDENLGQWHSPIHVTDADYVQCGKHEAQFKASSSYLVTLSKPYTHWSDTVLQSKEVKGYEGLVVILTEWVRALVKNHYFHISLIESTLPTSIYDLWWDESIEATKEREIMGLPASDLLPYSSSLDNLELIALEPVVFRTYIIKAHKKVKRALWQ